MNHVGRVGTLEERFLRKINKTEECWEWVAFLTKTGYGFFAVRPGKRALSHRVAYELYKGPIPKGMFVCHTCDNRKCVNPAHLFLGTNADNMADMVRKGRALKKITLQDKIIIALDSRPMTHIAKDFNISEAYVRKLKKEYNAD